jgi:hypothetical protein
MDADTVDSSFNLETWPTWTKDDAEEEIYGDLVHSMWVLNLQNLLGSCPYAPVLLSRRGILLTLGDE